MGYPFILNKWPSCTEMNGLLVPKYAGGNREQLAWLEKTCL